MIGIPEIRIPLDLDDKKAKDVFEQIQRAIRSIVENGRLYLLPFNFSQTDIDHVGEDVLCTLLEDSELVTATFTPEFTGPGSWYGIKLYKRDIAGSDSSKKLIAYIDRRAPSARPWVKFKANDLQKPGGQHGSPVVIKTRETLTFETDNDTDSIFDVRGSLSLLLRRVG